MQTCVEEGQLIRLFAGELPPEQAETIAAHLEACSTCSDRYWTLAATWDVLGRWQIPVPPGGFREQVLAAATARRPRREWMPLAASVVLAVGLGATAALLRPPGPPPQVLHVSTERVTEMLGLDALAEDAIALDEVFGSAGDTRPREEES